MHRRRLIRERELSPRGLGMLPGFVLLAIVFAPFGTHASHADHPELLRLLDLAEYVAAEDSARALYESAPARSEDEATGVDLFLRAARLSGRAPVAALLGLAQQILTEREESYGPNDAHVADILHELGNLQLRADDAAGAAQTHARGLALRTALGDTLSLAWASSAQALANAKLRRGEWDQAEQLYRRALRVAARARPTEPFRRAFAINGLGLVAQHAGDLDGAQHLFEEALAASYDPRVEDHPRTATIARNLGRLLLNRGQGDRALASLRTAYRIRTRRLDATSLHLGNAAQDLARAEAESGQLAAAVDHARQALRIREARLGPAHPATLASRELLVRLLTEAGDFAAAEAELDAFPLAPDDVEDADRVKFLRANLLNEQGDYARARAAYEALLRERRRRWGADDPRLAATLHNLSEVARRLGDAEAALTAREEAVELQARALPADDPDRVRGLVNLADLRLDFGQVARARPLLAEADSLLARRLGSEHPERANVLYLLAECELLDEPTAGDARRAVELCRQALDLQRAAYGENHAEVAWGRERLARAQLLAGDFEAGLREALRAAELQQRQVRWAVQGLAEHSALRFAAASMGATDLALAGLFHAARARDRLREPVYERVLAGRSLVLEAMLQRRREVRRAARGNAAAWQEVQEARARLAATAANRSASGTELQVLSEERDRAEAAWARSLGRRAVDGLTVSAEAISARLGSAGALLSFVRFDAALPGRQQRFHYAALLLRADGAISLRDLGAAAAIDDLVLAWRAAVRDPLGQNAEDRCREVGARLREALVDPLGNLLEQVDELWLVLDGSLHGVAFPALPLASGEYWAEAGPLVHLLDQERALLERSYSPAAEPRGVAFGDPDFGQATPSRDPCAPLSRLRFAALPQTRQEIAEVAAHVPGLVVYEGAEATEGALRDIAPTADVLHLATHGFFLGEDCASVGEAPTSPRGLRGIGGLRSRRRETSAPPTNPLLRSGLVLARANDRGPLTSADEDGILLADEILGLSMPLGSWVVLSACDTGVGEVQVGEGVLGLRRAFALAGASQVIMSLWPVEDRSTQEWMGEFYRAKWEQGERTARSAQLASRRVLAARRARAQSTHPFWWAAFVAAGGD